ncbi:hypothetical protein ACQP00_38925 [Dactylosporangium sp. CS-047395]|uniref:hypothetical protein n=1 Tax=Dactylosporangium sp. CS-047395 TaxID=3239936 RepID=UPI003D94AD44
MRATPVIASVLLLAACASPAHQTGDAAPAGSAAAPTSAAASPAAGAAGSPSAPASTKAPGSPSGGTTALTLGPTGLGSLRLGMTRTQANATGMLKPDIAPDAGDCTTTHLKGAPTDAGTVTWRSDRGVVAIDAYGTTMHTPEGVHIGMSRDDMLKIYPEWHPVDGNGDDRDGRGYGKARGNPAAVYRIWTTSGQVSGVTLQRTDQGCYE